MPHPLHRAPLRTVVLSLLGILILGSVPAQAAGSITYVIEKSAAPTADELDAYTRIQKAMDSVMRGRTSIIIAHRLSTIRHVDQILVLRRGEIIERGRHDELIRQGGYYRTLYELLQHSPAG